MKCDVKGTDALEEAKMLKVLLEIISKSVLMLTPCWFIASLGCMEGMLCR
jgi:hypothetical protein